VSEVRLSELLARWDEGGLSPDEAAEVERLLASGADLRKLLVERDLLTVGIAHHLVLEGEGPARARPARRAAWIATSAAALAVAAAVVLVVHGRGAITERATAVLEPPVAPTGAVVLRGLVVAVRAGQRRPLDRAAELVPGDAVEIPAGAQLAITRGAGVKVLVEPREATRFGLARADGETEPAWLRLDGGTLSAQIDASASPVGFVTAHARVRAIEAGFRIAASARDTRVEVLTGAVEVRAVMSGQALRVAAGEAAWIDALGAIATERAGSSPREAAGWTAAAERAAPGREWGLLRSAPEATLRRLAEMRRGRALAVVRRPESSTCAGGQVGPGQLLIDGVLLRDRALADLGREALGATFEREAMTSNGRDGVLCLAHWVADLAHTVLVLRQADDGLAQERDLDETTERLRRAAQRLADPSQGRFVRMFHHTPAYAIAGGVAFALAGEVLADDGLIARGRAMLGRTLAGQRGDGAFLMGTPPGPDTDYQAMALRRLAWWALLGHDEQATQAFARGAQWLEQRVGPAGDVDLGQNIKTRGCAPGAICRGKHDDEIASSLLYYGALHDAAGLEAAARFLEARAPRRP
jgi:hypothetical protein